MRVKKTMKAMRIEKLPTAKTAMKAMKAKRIGKPPTAMRAKKAMKGTKSIPTKVGPQPGLGAGRGVRPGLAKDKLWGRC